MNNIRKAAALMIMLFGAPALGTLTAIVLTSSQRPIRFMDVTLGDASLGSVLRIGSVAAALFGAALIFIMWSAAVYCRNDRARLVAVFGPLVRVVSYSLIALIVLQAAITLYSLIVLEVGFLHFFSWGVALAIAAGAIAGAGEMARSNLRLNEPLTSVVVGKNVSPKDQPRLWQFVGDLAARLGARGPNNIVVGLDPTFFVTAARVELAGADTVLSGETLYVSLPLLRVLSREELGAVVGHELGHFLGEDTAFSQRFVPIYRGLTQALVAAHSQGGWHALACAPAQAVLEFGIQQFARAERAISRERELAADRSGARAASPQAVIAALLHMAPADAVWTSLIQMTVSTLNAGQQVVNMSTTLTQQAIEVANMVPPAEWLSAVRDLRQPHPTDTHPTAANRADMLGVALDEALLEFGQQSERAVEIIDAVEMLEQALSATYQRLLVERGIAKPPRNRDRPTASEKKRATLAKRTAARRGMLAAASVAPVETTPESIADPLK